MPLISADGSVQPILYVVLQERTNLTFGPIIQKKLFQHPLLKVSCSISGEISITKCAKKLVENALSIFTGKMTKEHTVEFFRDVVHKCVSSDAILILDSWSGQRDKTVDDISEHLTVEYIPPGTTGMIQPCDVYYFRPYKNFVRTLCNKIRQVDTTFVFSERNNILKLQLVTHSQFMVGI